MSHRLHVDNSVKLIGKLLFGISEGSEVLNKVRPAGQPLADDWTCLKNMVNKYIHFYLSSLSSIMYIIAKIVRGYEVSIEKRIDMVMTLLRQYKIEKSVCGAQHCIINQDTEKIRHLLLY